MLKELQESSLEVKLPKRLEDEIERVARERSLTKKQVEELKEEVKRAYLKSRFEAGEAVGIITAQSISEPSTQMTMRTYHIAGTAGIKVTHGLPRLIEIFDAKKVPEVSNMTIFLKDEYNNERTAAKVANEIIERTAASITKAVSLNLDKGQIEIELIDARAGGKVAKLVKERVKDAALRKKGSLLIIQPKGKFGMKELQRLKEKILGLEIAPVKGIINAMIRKEGKRWVITTTGSNLEEVLKLKEVDPTRTITSDIHETAGVLGIEAARNAIVAEVTKTLAGQGLDVDIRHIGLVADIMTFSGTIRPIGRYGIAGSKRSILARAAFEETIKHLIRASVKREAESFKGIFENVLIGQVISAGTGMFELIAKPEEESK